jgi:hypothetical protein
MSIAATFVGYAPFWAGARCNDQVTGDVTAHYSTISLARTGFSQVLTLSALKVLFMTYAITNPNPNPNYGTWYIGSYAPF